MCYYRFANSEDISARDVTITVTQYLWLAKSGQNKRTENLHTSNDCHFTYMLDLSLSFCRGSNVEGSMSMVSVPLLLLFN